MKKQQHLFYYGLFSAVCDTQQSKDDVIDVVVTSLSILHSLFLKYLISQKCFMVIGGNWTTNDGETERGTIK